MKMVFQIMALTVAISIISCIGQLDPKPPDYQYSIIAERPQELDLQAKRDSDMEVESEPSPDLDNPKIINQVVRKLNNEGEPSPDLDNPKIINQVVRTLNNEEDCLANNIVFCAILGGSCVLDKSQCRNPKRLVLGNCRDMNCHCCFNECPQGFIENDVSQLCYKLSQCTLRPLTYSIYDYYDSTVEEYFLPACSIGPNNERIKKYHGDIWSTDCYILECVGGAVHEQLILEKCCKDGDETKASGTTWSDDCFDKECQNGYLSEVLIPNKCCQIGHATAQNEDGWHDRCHEGTCNNGDPQSSLTSHKCCLANEGGAEYKDHGSSWNIDCYTVMCVEGDVYKIKLIPDFCCVDPEIEGGDLILPGGIVYFNDGVTPNWWCEFGEPTYYIYT